MIVRWAPDGTLIIDPDRTVSLRDVGGGDHHLAVARGHDGTVAFLLRDTASPEDPSAVLGVSKWPRHERVGPLPARDAWRCLVVLRDPPRPRCNRTTRHGDPCLTRVGGPGQACHHHRGAGPSRERLVGR